jgi:uncharacterized membrane protein
VPPLSTHSSPVRAIASQLDLPLAVVWALGLALGGLLVWAALLRLLGLEHLVVWHDEVFSLVRVFGYPQVEVEQAIFSHRPIDAAFLLHFQGPDPRFGWSDAWRAFLEHPEHAPLYYVLTKLATALAVKPIVAARGLSALFGLLAIPAAYWLMRELFGRGVIPWIAALLVACSPTHFLYSQEARQYALWTLTATAATAALVRALRTDKRSDWWLYGMLCAIGLWAHLLFALLLPIHAAYGLLARRGQPLAQRARSWGFAVGAALIAFSPWLLVLVVHGDRAVHYTEWLARPMGASKTLEYWATHLPRVFLDLNWPALGWWTLVLIPLAWAVGRFLRRAPLPAALLLGSMAAVYSGAMLMPDLLFDGIRSENVRYALPSMLALQLMVAWALGNALSAPQLFARRLAAGTVIGLALAGAVSLAAIARADAWWSKGYSSRNAALARELNGRAKPLVLASGSSVAVGDLISLAYRLDPRVVVFGERWGDKGRIPLEEFDPPLVMTPSLEMLIRVGWNQRLVPVEGTWQWFQAVPRTDLPSRSPLPQTDAVPDQARTEPPRPPQNGPVGDTP